MGSAFLKDVLKLVLVKEADKEHLGQRGIVCKASVIGARHFRGIK